MEFFKYLLNSENVASKIHSILFNLQYWYIAIVPLNLSPNPCLFIVSFHTINTFFLFTSSYSFLLFLSLQRVKPLLMHLANA